MDKTHVKPGRERVFMADGAAAANTRFEGGQGSTWREGKPVLASSGAGLRKRKGTAASGMWKKLSKACFLIQSNFFKIYRPIGRVLKNAQFFNK
jgi:hypothetical protein